MVKAGYSVASASAAGAIGGFLNNNGAERVAGHSPMMTLIMLTCATVVVIVTG